MLKSIEIGQTLAGEIADTSLRNCSILVVDDHEMNRELLTRRLEVHGHDVITAENGRQALDILGTSEFDLVLLDIMMPVMDGYETLEKMKASESLKDIPIIIISALDDMDSVVKCIEFGADDYLTKPFNSVLLKARINSCLCKKKLHDQEKKHTKQMEGYNQLLETRVQVQVEEISSAQLAAIFAMSKLAESKDPETGAHLERMREYCKVLSEQLAGLEKYSITIDDKYIENIYMASPLHDIGKVGIPDEVLLKPGKLTVEEFEIMKMHSSIGADTLRAVNRQHPGNDFILTGIDIAEGHHEKWNGSGYPYGRKGVEIPLSARILAVGDVYDALTSARCYKQAFSHEKSRGIILEGNGTHFDPEVVDAFLEMEDEFIKIRNDLQDEPEL